MTTVQEDAVKLEYAFPHRICRSWTGRDCSGNSHRTLSEGRWKLKQAYLQITTFPRPKCIVHLADAAAIKVRLL